MWPMTTHVWPMFTHMPHDWIKIELGVRKIEIDS
jgi:hypothetical protein